MMLRSTRGRLVLVIALAVVMSGCTSYKAPMNYRLPDPISPRIPVRVGLYLSKKTRTYVVAQEDKMGLSKSNYYFTIGPAFCNGIEKMLRGTFAEVVVIESEESGRSDSGLDAIMTADIVDASCLPSAAIHKEGTRFFLRVRYECRDLNDKVLWVDTFEGEAGKRQSIFGEVYTDVMRMAMEQQFDNAFSGLVVSKWWEHVPVPR